MTNDDHEKGVLEGIQREKLASMDKRLVRLEWAALVVVAFMAQQAINIVLRGEALIP